MPAYVGFTFSSLGCAFQLFNSCCDVESARTLIVLDVDGCKVKNTHTLCVLFSVANTTPSPGFEPQVGRTLTLSAKIKIKGSIVESALQRG